MNVRVKLIALCLVVFCALCSYPAMAYMDEAVVLEQGEIVKLTDTQLVDAYIEVIIELEAVKAFHTTSGFKPKEYTAYKDLLRYRIRLIMEMRKRGIETPVLYP